MNYYPDAIPLGGFGGSGTAAVRGMQVVLNGSKNVTPVVVILIREGEKIVAKSPAQVPKLWKSLQQQLARPKLTPTVGKANIPQFIEKAEGELARSQNPGFWNSVRDFFLHSAQFFGN